MGPVRFRLPPGHEAGVRASMTGASDFNISDADDGTVWLEPKEGAGRNRRYFRAHKVADAATNLDDDVTWSVLAVHPPVEKPNISLPSTFDARRPGTTMSPTCCASAATLRTACSTCSPRRARPAGASGSCCSQRTTVRSRRPSTRWFARSCVLPRCGCAGALQSLLVAELRHPDAARERRDEHHATSHPLGRSARTNARRRGSSFAGAGDGSGQLRVADQAPASTPSRSRLAASSTESTMNS